MLDREAVAAEAERLRGLAAELPDAERAEFHREAARTLRDPDTYAALNWFLVVGLHHFYLGRWWRGLADWVGLALGVALVAAGQPLAGTACVLVVLALEVWALFRSQVIVADWNNRLLRSLLARYRPELRA